MSYEEGFDRLAQKEFPRSKLVRAWPLKGGISAEMTALEIATAEGDVHRWIVRRPAAAAFRRNPRAAEAEFRLLEILHSHRLTTPAPRALDSTGEIFGTPYLVIEYIEGQPEFAPAQPADFAAQMAEELARVHALDENRADLSFLPRQAEGLAANQELVSSHAAQNAALDDRRIRAALAIARPFEPAPRAVLLHGDYWPGNILWREGRLAAVIDWEDAAIGDPLADLAIGRLDLLWIYGREAMEVFTRHYLAQTAIDPRNLPAWDLSAALRLARLVGADLDGWAAFFHEYGRVDITAQSIAGHFDFYVTQAIEQLKKPK